MLLTFKTTSMFHVALIIYHYYVGKCDFTMSIFGLFSPAVNKSAQQKVSQQKSISVGSSISVKFEALASVPSFKEHVWKIYGMIFMNPNASWVRAWEKVHLAMLIQTYVHTWITSEYTHLYAWYWVQNQLCGLKRYCDKHSVNHHHHQQHCNSASHHCCCHASCWKRQFPYYHNFVTSDTINMKWDQSKNTPSWPANRNFGLSDQAIIFKQSDLIRIDNNFYTAHDSLPYLSTYPAT